jgi:hypothetical protein
VREHGGDVDDLPVKTNAGYQPKLVAANVEDELATNLIHGIECQFQFPAVGEGIVLDNTPPLNRPGYRGGWLG